MKILLPVDGSEYTKRMLDYVATHDDLLGSRHDYTLCTVVPRISGRAASFLDRATTDDYYHDEAHEILQPLQYFVDQAGWKVRLMPLKGHAAEEIASLATSEKHDLIVMGAHGHSVFGNVLMGSVTTGVIGRCSVPVLLIR